MARRKKEPRSAHRDNMEKKIYITEEERAKRQKVADAFAELYDMADIVVADVGRYGFVA